MKTDYLHSEFPKGMHYMSLGVQILGPSGGKLIRNNLSLFSFSEPRTQSTSGPTLLGGGPKRGPKICRGGPKLGPKICKGEPKHGPKMWARTKSGPNSGPKMFVPGPKWDQQGTKKGPKLHLNDKNTVFLNQH